MTTTPISSPSHSALASHTPTRRPVSSLISGTNRAAQAQALRTAFDAAAELINTQHAQVLSAVIEAKEANLHRTAFGFSALRDWLVSTFDFHNRTAADIAAIARLSRKFPILAAAATTGRARIDQVAYAVRQLDRTPAMRLFARTPFRAPAVSPFDDQTQCATPEHLIAEYCRHAPIKDLQRHLDSLAASLAEETELLEGLGEQSLQWIELAELDNGMWALSGELAADTGRLLDKYLKTACPPPRQDEQDGDEVLPPRSNRHAEAFHQLLAGYGTSPDAAKRHGHTATLDLTVDIETLQGKDTGRLPLLEGKPISVAQARLLACEAGVIPSVFDYQSGEAVELGRAARLPNASLRRKLELEQPEGCAWSGCGRPVAWTEAHHIVHWADGGETNADNLILLCRFHHGRIHTAGWEVVKTGPGKAVITHHDHTQTNQTTTPASAKTGTGTATADSAKAGTETATAASTQAETAASPGTRTDSGAGTAAVRGATGRDSTGQVRAGEGGTGQVEEDWGGCGCSDWRSDQDMDAENSGTEWDIFPTGLYRSEWAQTLKPDLDARAQAAEQQRALAAIREARAKCRARFTGPVPETEPAGVGKPPPIPHPRTGREPLPSETGEPVGGQSPGDPPFLGCPLRQRPGWGKGSCTSGPHCPSLPARTLGGFGPFVASMEMHARGDARSHRGPGVRFDDWHGPRRRCPVAPGTRQPYTPPRRALHVAARLNRGLHRTRRPENQARPSTHLVVADSGTAATHSPERRSTRLEEQIRIRPEANGRGETEAVSSRRRRARTPGPTWPSLESGMPARSSSAATQTQLPP